MTRQKKSRSGGQPGAAATATRDSVRHLHYTTGQSGKATPVCVGRKVIGYVSGDVFRKVIRGSVHILHTPRAIAFDVSTLHDAERAGARFVEVVDSETGRLYRAALATVWARGWEFDRGHGRQWALRLEAFNRPEEPAAAQLSLFGGAA